MRTRDLLSFLAWDRSTLCIPPLPSATLGGKSTERTRLPFSPLRRKNISLPSFSDPNSNSCSLAEDWLVSVTQQIPSHLPACPPPSLLLPINIFRGLVPFQLTRLKTNGWLFNNSTEAQSCSGRNIIQLLKASSVPHKSPCFKTSRILTF